MHNSAPFDYEALLAAEGMPSTLCMFTDGFEQLPDNESSELDKAGVDAGTDSCTFLEMQGRNIFVTGDSDEATEGELASSC